jgi:hypothetical protein
MSRLQAGAAKKCHKLCGGRFGTLGWSIGESGGAAMAHHSSSETEELSEETLTLVRRALQRIAADHEVTPTGHRKKLTRHEAINIAREVCRALGWDYGYQRDKLG